MNFQILSFSAQNFLGYRYLKPGNPVAVAETTVWGASVEVVSGVPWKGR